VTENRHEDLSTTGCKPTAAPQAPAAANSSTVAPAIKVAKIVFIDKEHACDCTRKRVEGTWAALQNALGTIAKLPVERIHVDTEPAKAEAYTKLKPLMAPPGIYFVDGHGGVLELLQGEIDADEIRQAIEK
jgi:hypothetical protein